jgi:hypothetical protein
MPPNLGCQCLNVRFFGTILREDHEKIFADETFTKVLGGCQRKVVELRPGSIQIGNLGKVSGCLLSEEVVSVLCKKCGVAFLVCLGNPLSYCTLDVCDAGHPKHQRLYSPFTQAAAQLILGDFMEDSGICMHRVRFVHDIGLMDNIMEEFEGDECEVRYGGGGLPLIVGSPMAASLPNLILMPH